MKKRYRVIYTDDRSKRLRRYFQSVAGLRRFCHPRHTDRKLIAVDVWIEGEGWDPVESQYILAPVSRTTLSVNF